MTEEDISQEFRLKKIKEINQNEWLTNKNEKIGTTRSYNWTLFTLVFVVPVCTFISAFVSLVDISK